MIKTYIGLFFLPVLLLGAEYKSSLNITMQHANRVAARIIVQALTTLGQRFTIHRYDRDDQTVQMSISMNGTRPFEPKYFGEILRENALVVSKGSVKNNQWTIVLDASDLKWNVSAITPDEGAQMEKSALSSWFVINQATAINIEAPYSGKWYPDVAILDSNMEVLSSLREFKPQEKLTFALPSGAMYMKVSSTNGMKLLKEGMWIEHASE